MSALTALCTPATNPLVGHFVRLASQLNAYSWNVTSAIRSIAHSDLYTNSKNMSTQKPLISTFNTPLASSCNSQKCSFLFVSKLQLKLRAGLL